ncbi:MULTISPECIES: Gfo/Idh/MocA family protein [Streptomyces]|uniref:Gfo/Idh/MocA family protein n=1 Tax=Streptomyces TaxID=1883 RepID=UPI00345B9B4C
MRTLVVGVGEVGAKHLAALTDVPELELVAVADPAQHRPLGLPVFAGYRQALTLLQPELAVVATPPGIALTIARDAAKAGATVLVEKPATLHPGDLAPQPGDERIYVAFQPHFAPGLHALLARPPQAVRADVLLTCHRDPHYYRDWRRTAAQAGGVLHQQAIHGLALALRLLGDHPIAGCVAETVRWRRLSETEDRVYAQVELEHGRALTISARVDDPGPARHEVTIRDADGTTWCVQGRNLEAGLGPAAEAPTHQALRCQLYRALHAVHHGQPTHPCLAPLSALRQPLEVIDHVYRHARQRHTSAA